MGSPMLTYPETLGTMDRHKHYVMFYINQQAKSKINFGSGSYDTSPNPPGSVRAEATTLSMKRAPTRRLSQAIALYMPAKLALSHTANYGEQEMGAVVAGASSLINTLSSGQSNTDIAKELGKKMVEKGAAQLEQMALMTLDATIAPGAKAAVEIARGTVLNNRTEMAFEGIGRREFSFEFRMLPNNAKEAETPDIETLASDSTANEPTLNDAETPDGSTTAEPIPEAAVVAAEKDTPDTDTSAPSPTFTANSPHAPRP